MYKLTLGHTKRVLSICKSNMQKREEVRKEYREQKCIKKRLPQKGAFKSQNGGRKLIERAWKSIGDYALECFSFLPRFVDVFIFGGPPFPHMDRGLA